jgi:hypothetical protein
MDPPARRPDPGTTNIHRLHGARLFFPDERAAEFLPLLERHWASHT